MAVLDVDDTITQRYNATAAERALTRAVTAAWKQHEYISLFAECGVVHVAPPFLRSRKVLLGACGYHMQQPHQNPACAVINKHSS